MKALVLGVVGIALLLAGVLGLAAPVSVDDGPVSVGCGSGFSGTDDTPEVIDDARDLTAEVEGTTHQGSTSRLAGACADKITVRRVWGWPACVLGLALIGGAVAIRRRPA